LGTDVQPFTWVGKLNYQQDTETGLYFLGGGGNGGRYYDPPTARFLTKDPIEHGGEDANLYRYCTNDPINLADPSGAAPPNRIFGNVPLPEIPTGHWNGPQPQKLYWEELKQQNVVHGGITNPPGLWDAWGRPPFDNHKKGVPPGLECEL